MLSKLLKYVTKSDYCNTSVSYTHLDVYKRQVLITDENKMSRKIRDQISVGNSCFCALTSVLCWDTEDWKKLDKFAGRCEDNNTVVMVRKINLCIKKKIC